MKSFELDPNQDNLITTFINDTIGRTADVCSFVNMLSNIEGGCTISIDGKWGTGKTFFIKQTKIVLDSINPWGPFSESNEAQRVVNKLTQINREFIEKNIRLLQLIMMRGNMMMRKIRYYPFFMRL